jgi:hypothetical protein
MYATILEILAIVIPLFIGVSKKVVKGNKKWIIAIVAYFILKKWASQAALQKSLEELQENGYLNANALATLYDKAINPSGISYLVTMDGTDENAIFELAAKTGNYKDVADAYRIQYKRELTNDLKSELSGDDYRRYLSILNKA